MLTDKRFEFETAVTPLFPEVVPWDLVGTMTSKVLKREFDWELSIQTTYIVGCCLTVAAKNSGIVTPTVLNSPCPDTCTDEVCEEIANQLKAISNTRNTVGFSAESIDPAILFTLIQLAIKILSMFGRKKS